MRNLALLTGVPMKGSRIDLARRRDGDMNSLLKTLEAKQKGICDFLARLAAVRRELASVRREIASSSGPQPALEDRRAALERQESGLVHEASDRWLSEIEEAKKIRETLKASYGFTAPDPCRLYTQTLAQATAEIAIQDSPAAKALAKKLESLALRQAAEQAREAGKLDIAYALEAKADALSAGEMILHSARLRRAASAKTPGPLDRAVKMGTVGQALGRKVNGAVPHTRLSGARLGFYYKTPSEIRTMVRGLLASQPTPYDAFVKFVLDNVPADVAAGWTADPFQVGEALRTFERNYGAGRQTVQEATAWGLRFPEDLRADMAYKRVELADPVYVDQFEGHYQPVGAYFSGTTAVNLIPALGKRPIVLISGDAFTVVQNLLPPTSGLFYWYAHVFRALQNFIPLFAEYVEEGTGDASEIYGLFNAPVDYPAGFTLWAVLTNFYMFSRLDIPIVTARHLLTNEQLAQIEEGEQMAVAQGQAELFFLKLIGSAIKTEIKYLELAEYVAKILAFPVKTAGDVVAALAAGTPWYVYVIGGTVVLVAGAYVYTSFVK